MSSPTTTPSSSESEIPKPLNSSRVTPETIGRAVVALKKWNKTRSKDEKPQLIDQDEFLYLVLTLKKIPSNGRTNPYKIPLSHSLHPSDSSEEHCLIIDDRSKSTLTSEAAKKKIKDEDIPISKVLKLSKLKTDYRAFEAKRKLCDSYDFFFADKRVIPLLPKLLGKQFYKKKKIPVPVDLTHQNWKEQIKISCSSALFYLRTGTCSVIKIARVSMENDEIIENVAAAIDGVVEIVPKKWTNVRSFHLKMSESLALPIYQSVPDLGLKIEGLKKVEESKEMELVEEGEEEEEKEKKTPAKKKGSNKGRIHEVRYMDDDLGEALDNLSDEEENENAELGDKLVGKKRKKVGSSKKDKVLDEEKKSNKSSKVKKVAIVKQDDGDVENEVVDDVSLSGESKKKKKTSKTEKSESGELKMKDKKSKRTTKA
ncbi:putative ribosome biogenesis protein C8F11.04 [Papaver somniferum]|uniref:putative ribosome biogenesis protein C8F11.04 n=1 Tax=Papaver somniferum TaxID=3469 RepID=UPI000E703A99|nr:putative ribosome biogenesis protein C8F11.04 [Papaver somniferum]